MQLITGSMKWNIYLLRVKWVIINSRDVQWTMLLEDEDEG